MPSLTRVGNRLILSIADSPDLAANVETKMFFRSILDYHFDEKANLYVFNDIDDIVKTSRVIQDTVSFLAKRGKSCNLDGFSNTILNDSTKSGSDFVDSSMKGLAVKNSGQISLTLPVDFKRTLLPYQIKSVKHLVEVGHAANFSVPGSGKTTITYAAFSMWKNSGIVDKIMVVGPRSSFMPWEEEFEECFGKKPKSLRLDRNAMLRIVDNAENKELILTTYQLMSNYTNEIIDLLTNYKFLLVLDESHHVKRLNGGLWASSALKIAPYATRRAILSGTPMPQSPNDLWTQLTFLWPYKNLLGDSTTYKRQTQKQNGIGSFIDRISPFYTRIKKNDLSLKEPKFEKKLVPLNKYQRIIYEAIAAKTLEEIESMDERAKLHIWRRNKIIRLLQAASNPSLLNEFSEEYKIPPISGEGLPVSVLIENYSNYEIPTKLVKAAEIARQIMASGEKVIVWTAFIHNIKTLQNVLLQDLNPLVIFGDIPKDENEDDEVNREKIISEFKNDIKPRVLIANPSSLAESVSLHKNEKGNVVCKNAIYVDRTFDAGQYVQSLDRIHRIGLDPTTEVKYTILIGQGTVDEVIEDRLNEKIRVMFEALNDDFSVLNLENSISNVSDSELDKDFESMYAYLKKRKGETNDKQSQGAQ